MVFRWSSVFLILRCMNLCRAISKKLKQLAKELHISTEELSKRAEALHESNPMMGHRGVRLGVTYPEVSAMQIRAIFEAAAELLKEGNKPYPEIMIPVVCDVKELQDQLAIAKKVYDEVIGEVCFKEDQSICSGR